MDSSFRTTRQLRSNAKIAPPPPPSTSELTTDSPSPIRFIPGAIRPGPKIISDQNLPDLNKADLHTLRNKQRRLRNSVSLTLETTRTEGAQALRALESTLIFAQSEAGTGVCIDSRGWILTCAHCFGETAQEWKAERRKWMLYYTGLAVEVECRAWDLRRDLALAKIIRIEMEREPNGYPIFSHVSLATDQYPSTPIFCIGQPGADDLESTAPRKTAYDLIEVSNGRLCGLIPEADPHDNSEIGVLKHDAWTYWGHSGAPLLRQADGTLLGLHSSWDDSTAMRHGVPLVAIRVFLEENLPVRLDP